MTRPKQTLFQTVAVLLFIPALLICADTVLADGFSVRALKSGSVQNEEVGFSISCSETSRVFVFQGSYGFSNLIFPFRGENNRFSPGTSRINVVARGRERQFIIVAAPEWLFNSRSSAAQLETIAKVLGRGEGKTVSISRINVPGIKNPGPLQAQVKAELFQPGRAENDFLSLVQRSTSASMGTLKTVEYSSGRKGVMALYLETPSGELRILTEKNALPDRTYVLRFPLDRPGGWRLHLAWADRAAFLPSIALGELASATNIETINFEVR